MGTIRTFVVAGYEALWRRYSTMPPHERHVYEVNLCTLNPTPTVCSLLVVFGHYEVFGLCPKAFEPEPCLRARDGCASAALAQGSRLRTHCRNSRFYTPYPDCCLRWGVRLFDAILVLEKAIPSQAPGSALRSD